MKIRFFLLMVLLTAIIQLVNGQKSFMKFGDIPDEDMSMTVYSNDTTAAAVFLGDYGLTHFLISEDEGFYLQFNRHTRIKILKKSAFDWADFYISLYIGQGGKSEDLSMIKGFTFNLEDGKVVKQKLERDAIFYEDEDKNHKSVKFTMPNVKVGSVIDVIYTITSPYTFTLNDWYFQQSIPVRKSVYNVKIPEYYNYKNWTTGYVPIIKETETFNEKFQYTTAAEVTPTGRIPGSLVNFDAMVTRWIYTAENVPAFINEPYITTKYDYLGAVEFELTSTNFPGSLNKYYSRKWEDVNREMLEDFDFGQQLNNSGHLRDLILSINAKTNDPAEKMRLAYENISKSIHWDSRYRLWPSGTLRKAFNDAQGTSSDINMNLVTLCRALGLNANPVLVSTRSNGKVRQGQVILTQFNHVIAHVQIGDKSYVMDAVNPNCPYFLLPAGTLNEKGMMISEKGYQWVDLYSKLPDKVSNFYQFTLNSDMQFTGKIQRSYENFSAVQERQYIRSLADTTEYQKKMEQNISGLTIHQIQLENKDSIYKPLKLIADVTLQDRAMQGGEKIYFNPLLLSRLEENPFKNEERKFPIDYNYPSLYKTVTMITIPEGYVVEELPQSVIVSLPDNGGRFLYNLKSAGQNISLTTELSINQTIFPSINYAEIKKFYEIMVSKQAEQIVLKASSL